MMSTMSIRGLLCVCLLAPMLGVWAADLSVQVERQRLTVDDILGVRLSAEGETQGEPDFTPLMKDFDILGQGQSQVTSIVNGKISQTRQWTLQLAPKRTGRLEIPAISIGPDRSTPVTVEVTDSTMRDTRTTDSGPKPLFLEAEIDTSTPYVQQVLDYRVKVYFSQEPQRAVLSEPQADGATIEPFGQDRGYDEDVDGQRYRVIERRYLITPRRSGQLTIQAPRLEAMLPDTSRSARRDPFADLDEAFGGTLFQSFPQIPGVTHPGRRVVVRAENIDLEVRPQPAGSGSPWLPATSVQVSDEWTPSPPVFRVGEPVTRTLTITAQGTTSAQLPDLDLGTIAGAQVYPDQPQSEDLSNGPEPSAVKRFKTALVPTRAGPLELPEIRLQWWDHIADAARVVVVPQRTVEVMPAPAGSERQTPVVAPEPVSVQSPPEPSKVAEPQSMYRDDGQIDGTIWQAGFWPWLALLLGLIWLTTLVWWYRDRRARRGAHAPSEISDALNNKPIMSLKAAVRAVERACSINDPRATRAALIDWGGLRWPDNPPHGLESLAQNLNDDQLGAVLRSIDRAIYAPSGMAWDGMAIWTSLEPFLSVSVKTTTSPNADSIPGLYPDK